MGTIAVGAALYLQLVQLQAGAGWAWTGKVVGIVDGDTITVLRDGHEQVKIRLYGIDAPESGWAFGKAPKQDLSSMVHG
jgi:endonuclease YncB( thermonuclease family)